MNSDEKAFLQQIIENPQDDTPRHIFCDWLVDQGQDDRASFIRTQMAIHAIRVQDQGLTEKGSMVRLYELTRESYRLFQKHWRELVGPGVMRCIQEERDLSQLHRAFSRGFISEATTTAEKWMECGDELASEQPIERVFLTTQPSLMLQTNPWNMYTRCRIVGGNSITQIPDRDRAMIPHEHLVIETIENLLHHQWPRIEFSFQFQWQIPQDPNTYAPFRRPNWHNDLPIYPLPASSAAITAARP